MTSIETTTRTPSRASALAPVEVVAAIYAAFGRDDVAGVLALCAEDVVFDDDSSPTDAQRAGHPLLCAHRGKSGVADYFAALATYQVGRFEVLDLMVASGNSPDPASGQALHRVAARILLELTAPTGVVVSDDEMHLWGIGADGLVHTMRHYCDTAKHIASLGASMVTGP